MTLEYFSHLCRHVLSPFVDVHKMVNHIIQTFYLRKLVDLPKRVLIQIKLSNHSIELGLEDVADIDVPRQLPFHC